MKSSIIVPLQNPTPFSPLAPEADLWTNLSKAVAAGYDGVELAITNPTTVDPARVKQLLEEHCLVLSAITTGQAYGLEGISLTSAEEDRRQKALERIKNHARLAASLNADAVVIVGLIRGEGGHESDRSYLRDALIEFGRECPDIRFALEPLNRYECAFINTVEEALGLLNEIELSNLGLLFDTFHANIEERSFGESIRSAGERIFHVHVADSNRFVPGYGHLDFTEVGAALRDIGYQGFCTLECFPNPGPDACLQEAATFIKEL